MSHQGNQDSNWDERRIAVRHPGNPESSCRFKTTEEQEEATAGIWNISSEGICLVVGRQLTPGVPFSVELHSPDREFSCRLPVQAIHTTRRYSGAWMVGGSFLDARLNTDQLRSLLGRDPALSEVTV